MECHMCVVLYLMYFVPLLYAQYEGCTTPENKQGECVRIEQCLRLSGLLKKSPLPYESAEYLKRSHCGFENDDPLVCCPIDRKNNVKPTPRQSESKPSPKHGQSKGNLLPNADECGYVGDPKLVGGEEADLFDYPWMALLEYQKAEGRTFNCGGVLISKRYVLTAAHCIKSKTTSKKRRLVSVRLGEHNLAVEPDCDFILGEKVCNNKPIDIPIEEAIPHESFDPSHRGQQNDIGLLRLSRDVEFTDFVKPICLPVSQKLQNDDFSGTNMTVAGWGRTETRARSNSKRKLIMPITSNRQCKAVYDTVQIEISNGQICAGGAKGKDACTGDSGGPLMMTIAGSGAVNWYVGGIVSFGPTPCGLEGWPGVYTRVTKYVPWIIRNLKP